MFDTKLKIKDQKGEVKDLATWQMLQKVLSLCDAERAEMNEDLELPLKLLEKAYFITTFLKFCYWHLFSFTKNLFNDSLKDIDA